MADRRILVDFEVDPPLTDELRADLIELWRDVAEDGGAVGVSVPVDIEEVRALAATSFGRCERGEDHMVVALIGFEPVGLVFLEQRPGPLFRHWATVKRLQVHPILQGHGIGRSLLLAAQDFARAAGLEQLHLTVGAAPTPNGSTGVWGTGSSPSSPASFGSTRGTTGTRST